MLSKCHQIDCVTCPFGLSDQWQYCPSATCTGGSHLCKFRHVPCPLRTESFVRVSEARAKLSGSFRSDKIPHPSGVRRCQPLLSQKMTHFTTPCTEMGWATHVLHNSSTGGFRVTTQRDQACLIARSYIDAIASVWHRTFPGTIPATMEPIRSTLNTFVLIRCRRDRQLSASVFDLALEEFDFVLGQVE